MPSKNYALILGHLGKDPEQRILPSGDAVCNFSVATSEKWTDKQTDQIQEQTEWHNISAFGKLAENCVKYIHKGSLVLVEGQIKTRKVGEGQDAKYYTGIKAFSVTFLDRKEDRQQTQSQQGQADSSQTPLDEEDCPF